MRAWSRPKYGATARGRLLVISLISVLMTDERLLRLLGKRIRQLREERGMTQEGMKGLEYRHYQRIEYGQTNPSVKTLNKIAKVFKVSISELFQFD